MKQYQGKSVSPGLVLREILNGQLSPGEKIPQEQLAVLFGMSRTPVRDALIRLEEDRFLEKSGRAGYQVSRIRLKDCVDFCEFRLMLEMEIARYAAMRATVCGSSTTSSRVVRVLRAEGAVRVSASRRSTTSRGTARSVNLRIERRFESTCLNSIVVVFEAPRPDRSGASFLQK